MSAKFCAPGKKKDNISCITTDILLKIVEAWNSNQDHPKITIPNKEVHAQVRTHIITELEKYIPEFKNDQSSIIKDKRIIQYLDQDTLYKLQKYTWVPYGPYGENNHTWLNTNNINDVLKQQEYKYPKFYFLGAVPVDFADVPYYGLTDIYFQDYIDNNIDELGIVFNLDYSYNSGTHWVCAFISFKTGYVYYYDSCASKPPARIKKFLEQAHSFCKDKLNKSNSTIIYNDIRHQYGNSECGVYCIWLIIGLLHGHSFKELCKSKMPDKIVNEIRELVFRPPRSVEKIKT